MDFYNDTISQHPCSGSAVSPPGAYMVSTGNPPQPPQPVQQGDITFPLVDSRTDVSFTERNHSAARFGRKFFVTLPDDDDNKRNRKGLKKKMNAMKDILNIFLLLTLEKLPLFVDGDLPPLSLDNFDMSSVIKGMENIKKTDAFVRRGSRNIAICTR